jgi:muconate cycloisomerase
MRIAKIDSYPVNVSLKEAFVMSKSATNSVLSLIIRIITDTGLEGIGEARVGYNTGFTHENIEAMKTIVDKYYAPALLGRNALCINGLMDNVNAAWEAGYTITKSGIEMALYDIAGKHYGVSVAELLGGVYHEKIGLVGSVSCDEPQQMAAQAIRWAESGHKVLKVKIGRGADIALDVKRVKMVREAVGNEIELRLDCNSIYRLDTAFRLIKQLRKFDPAFLEDPIDRYNIDGMVSLTKVSDVPICVDNIIFTPQDAFNVVSKGAGHIIKVKLQRVGGFRNALKIISIAEAAGIPVVVGRGSTLSISAAAEHQLIAASKNVIPWGENTGPQKQEEDVVKLQPKIKGGYVTYPSGIGLGIELDEGKVNRYRVDLSGHPAM